MSLARKSAAVSDPQKDAASLAERMLHGRAIEAVIWGMPAVNFDRMLKAVIANGGKANQVVYWSQPVNSKDQTLTPNPDTIYFNPFYDTRNGPVVLDIPAAAPDNVIVGSIDTSWQNALEDIGPAGVDKGKGGKYLITPPGYSDKAPDGHIVLASDTYQGFAILRSNFKSRSDADIAAAVEHGKKVKIYALGGTPDSTVYVDVYDKAFDATIPYDLRFFESLHGFVQIEPWLTRDKVMIDVLKSIGIEKGKPFKPDAKTKAILEEAALEARAVVAQRYESGFDNTFFPGARWALPVPTETVDGLASSFADPNKYGIDDRAVYFSVAYFSTKHMGAGQFYLLTIHDSAGQPLDGSKTYRLTVPANAPVKQYWSATAYDCETHALIRGTTRSSRASTSSGLQKNPDGSVDIYFAAKAPEGKDANLVPTDPQRRFEVLFRFYGPEKPLFDKTWVLPDIEKAK